MGRTQNLIKALAITTVASATSAHSWYGYGGWQNRQQLMNRNRNNNANVNNNRNDHDHNHIHDHSRNSGNNNHHYGNGHGHNGYSVGGLHQFIFSGGVTCIDGTFWDITTKSCQSNVCVCAGGVASSGLACTVNGGVSCENCNGGFHMSKLTGQCTPDGCVCENGVPSTLACPAAGAVINHCKRCFIGYSLNRMVACEEDVCSCANGNGHQPSANGALCLTGTGCVSCNPGFHLENGKCHVNQCHCPSGVPATGLSCTHDNMMACASCAAGSHMHGNICRPDECLCPNGTPGDPATDCVGMTKYHCVTACNAGYTLNGNACEETVCSCPNGVGKSISANGVPCPTTLDVCFSCDVGFTLDAGSTACVANTCACQDPTGALVIGTPATGVQCTVAGGNICTACDASLGYHLHGTQCHENMCYCPGGIPKAKTECSSNGALDCAACSFGFHAVGNQCEENKCTCTLGWPKSISMNGHLCSQDGAEECHTCSYPHHLHGDVCV